MQHCSMLKEYAQYVARVRHYASDMSLNEAVKHAVDAVSYTHLDVYKRQPAGKYLLSIKGYVRKARRWN